MGTRLRVVIEPIDESAKAPSIDRITDAERVIRDDLPGFRAAHPMPQGQGGPCH